MSKRAELANFVKTFCDECIGGKCRECKYALLRGYTNEDLIEGILAQVFQDHGWPIE